MIIYLALNFASIYFFVPLLIGGMLVSMALRMGAQKALGWSLVALGAWGGVSGVPYWWRVIENRWDAKAHMDQQCKQAREQLPVNRLAARGVLLVRDLHGQLGRFDARMLVNPGLGGFSNIQERRSGGKGDAEIIEYAWIPDQHTTLGHIDLIKSGEIFPYELNIHSVTTDTDRRYGVEGAEFLVLERTTQVVVARRLQYVQWEQAANGMQEPSRACPSPAQEDNCKPAFDCTIGRSFVLHVLEPKIDIPTAQLFHLHRGMTAPRRLECVLPKNLLVGPGIQPEDIEWWAAGMEQSESLHLRVRGEKDELVCDRFFWAGGFPAPSLRFVDGRQINLETLRATFQRKPSFLHSPLLP